MEIIAQPTYPIVRGHDVTVGVRESMGVGVHCRNPDALSRRGRTIGQVLFGELAVYMPLTSLRTEGPQACKSTKLRMRRTVLQ